MKKMKTRCPWCEKTYRFQYVYLGRFYYVTRYRNEMPCRSCTKETR